MSSTSILLRRVFFLGVAILFVPFLLMVVMTPIVGTWAGDQMWVGSMTGGPVSPWLWVLLWLVVLVALGGIGRFLYGSFRDTGDQETDQAVDQETDQAIEELRTAYARGELSDEEFETRLERLRRDE